MGFGRGSVDFVGQQQLGEDGTRLELEVPPTSFILNHHLGANDVGGHQIGRELNAGEVELQRLAKRLEQEGFPQPGNAFQQNVPADEQCGENTFDQLFVTDDSAPQLQPQILQGLGGRTQAFFFHRGLVGLIHCVACKVRSASGVPVLSLRKYSRTRALWRGGMDSLASTASN